VRWLVVDGVSGDVLQVCCMSLLYPYNAVRFGLQQQHSHLLPVVGHSNITVYASMFQKLSLRRLLSNIIGWDTTARHFLHKS
jgi:tetrahydromethanopterin S-methyltransferase subunit C